MDGYYKQLLSIDDAEREAFDQKAACFLERMGATQRMCGRSGNRPKSNAAGIPCTPEGWCDG